MQVQQRPSLEVAALAEVARQTESDVQGIITAVKTIRSRSPREGAKSALAVLAATLMTPEEIAGAVYYVRDRHDCGAPIQFRRVGGILGEGLGDFVMTDQGFDLVAFPEDIAKVNKAAALVLAIKLGYERVAPGIWQETLVKKPAP